jgi:hypothetical protein
LEILTLARRIPVRTEWHMISMIFMPLFSNSLRRYRRRVHSWPAQNFCVQRRRRRSGLV